MRLKARLAGMLPTLGWKKEDEPYKPLVEREDSVPLSTEEVMGIVRELDERGQRKMAAVLQLPFAQRTAKTWPHTVFIKAVRTSLQEAKQDLLRKRRLTLAILQEVDPIIKAEASAEPETWINKTQQLVSGHGPWHAYWSCYFHPGREIMPERWGEHLQMMREQALLIPQKQAAETMETTNAVQTETSDEPSLFVEKIKKLEAKLHKETELRQKLEHEIAGLNKALRQSERKQELLDHRLTAEKERADRSEKETETSTRRIQNEQQLRKQEQERWTAEKETMAQKARNQAEELEKLQQQSERLAKERKRFRESELEWQRAFQDPKRLTGKLAALLHEEMSRITRDLTQGDGSGQRSKPLRQSMRSILDLLDALEAWLQNEEPAPVSLSGVNRGEEPRKEPGDDSASPPISALSHTSQPIAQERSEDRSSHTHEETASTFTSTFFRRDHGGYIRLDNGETINIPESLVIGLDLQHEAEVRCRPYSQHNGAVLYDIELLLQGDDSCSPIRQYDGYIQLGEHYTLYCVDINNPDNRYPIHRKDIEIQQPTDGTPCTFNVAADGEYARLSRVYRDFTTITERGAESATTRKPADRIRKQENEPAEKPNPFLSGCSIAILGGQRKWFEDIVTDTGAELVHDTGDNPERIGAALRRSNAIFMLLTSTSHKATWEGIEIAKAHGIPHFVIQGSKSNLRMQLWDNREQIRNNLHK